MDLYSKARVDTIPFVFLTDLVCFSEEFSGGVYVQCNAINTFPRIVPWLRKAN